MFRETTSEGLNLDKKGESTLFSISGDFIYKGGNFLLSLFSINPFYSVT